MESNATAGSGRLVSVRGRAMGISKVSRSGDARSLAPQDILGFAVIERVGDGVVAGNHGDRMPEKPVEHGGRHGVSDKHETITATNRPNK